MSALPPENRHPWGNSACPFCQNRTHAPHHLCSLFNHPVGAEQQRLRHLEAECLRSLEIDNQLELGRLLDGKIGRLCASQYFISVGYRATEIIGKVLPV